MHNATTIRDHNTEVFLADVTQWLQHALQVLRTEFDDWQFPHEACRAHWNHMLCSAGLVALNWPKAYGGRALPTATVIRFHELCAQYGAPQPLNSIAHSILAPTLLQFGSDAQKSQFLPGIREGSAVWCQGYSEPGSGSDLASVRTRAAATDNGWYVSGHKIWTTMAHKAQWCFALVRTDADSRAHQGLSFMLIDMTAPGVRVEQIRQLTGEADYNEVFFDQVFVPTSQVLGAVGEGWRIAMAAAEFERGVYFLPRVIQIEAELKSTQALLDAARNTLADAARIATTLEQLQDRCAVLRWRVNTIVERVSRGSTPGIDGAILKLIWSEARQALMDVRMELLGEAALLGPGAGKRFPREAAISREFLWSRAETIVAGTSEVQRNIIAERLLGLPKDKHVSTT
ncbi:MAG: acyl-CoA dehydrogenase family protein [Comamonas sp.]